MTINAIVGLGLRNITLSLSVAGWVVYARVVRGEVMSRGGSPRSRARRSR